jgi:hypothetical protein
MPVGVIVMDPSTAVQPLTSNSTVNDPPPWLRSSVLVVREPMAELLPSLTLPPAEYARVAAEKLDGRGGVVEEVRAVPDAEVVEVSAPVVSEVKSSLKIVV